MRLHLLLTLGLLLAGCASRPHSSAKPTGKLVAKKVSDEVLIENLLRETIPRTGQPTVETQGELRTERYQNVGSETILVFENDELRTETRKSASGTVLTRNWRDGRVSSLSYIGGPRSLLVNLDRDGQLTQKIITERGKKKAQCFWYEGRRVIRVEDESCLELLSGFD